MANDARRVGSKFETDILGYLRSHGADAERLAKAGKDDEGDIVLGGEYILELKARRAANSSLNLNAWLEEARREAECYRKARNLPTAPVPALVVKNPRKSMGKSFLVFFLEDLMDGEG